MPLNEKNAITERWITFFTCIADILIKFRISMISYDVFESLLAPMIIRFEWLSAAPGFRATEYFESFFASTYSTS